MEKETVRKLLLAMISPDVKLPSQQIFDEMDTRPDHTVMCGFSAILDNYFVDKAGSEANIAAVNGLLFGAALMYCSNKYPYVKTMIEEWTERQNRHRGENVFDFFDERAKRRKSYGHFPTHGGDDGRLC